MPDIFQARSYVNYLKTRLTKGGVRSGKQKEAAEFLRVHTTYVSQVLKEKTDLSLEHAESMNEFLGHTEEEGEYFILLVLKARAGTQKLKDRIEKRIQHILKSRLLIQKRIGVSEEISPEDQRRFYSSYHYSAMYVLTSLKEFQTRESMAKALNLPQAKTSEMVSFLISMGVVKEAHGRLLPGPRHMHLGIDTDIIAQHHSSWRLHALANFPTSAKNDQDIHYSAAVSLSKADAYKIKNMILENLKSNIDVISNSTEEEAYVYCFDFYKLLQN